MAETARVKKLKKRERTAPVGDPVTDQVDDTKLMHYLNARRELIANIQRIQDEMKEYGEQLREIEENYLPNLMQEVGVGKLTASDGTKIEVKPYMTASVSKRHEKAANKILKRIGAGDIAKVEMNFSFTKDEKENLKQLLDFSSKSSIPFEQKTSINTNALKAVAANALREGKLQPAELPTLGIFMITKAVVKEPKSKD